MNTGDLKNIVVLKDLPSNLVEEAIVVLKKNQKIPKLETTPKEKQNNTAKNLQQKNEPQKQESSKDYIIKEAQMLIAEYISKIENKNRKENLSIKKLNKKCERLKAINKTLLVILAISILVNFINL